MYRGKKISVVIPCYNEEEGIARVIPSLPTSVDEVIVVDNNSTDKTAQIAEGFGARVVFEPINQISRARNSGARAADGRYLVFLDEI